MRAPFRGRGKDSMATDSLPRGRFEYECRICAKAGLIRGGDTPESFVEHMHRVHRAPTSVKDVLYLKAKQAEREAAKTNPLGEQ